MRKKERERIEKEILISAFSFYTEREEECLSRSGSALNEQQLQLQLQQSSALSLFIHLRLNSLKLYWKEVIIEEKDNFSGVLLIVDLWYDF